MPSISIIETAKSTEFCGWLLKVVEECSIKSRSTGFDISFTCLGNDQIIRIENATIVGGQIRTIVDLAEKTQEIYIWF